MKRIVKTYWLVLFAMLMSCGSRKVAINGQSTEHKGQEKTETEQVQTTMTTEQLQIQDFQLSDLLDIEIKPINDSVSDFHFSIEGKEFSGRSNGVVFIRRDKGQRSLIKGQEKKETEQKETHEKKAIKTQVKTETKEKATERKESKVFTLAIFLLFVMVLLLLGLRLKGRIIKI